MPLADSHDHRAAWVVTLLCLLNVAAFLDAMILALLMAPIHAQLGVTDAQLGLLFGLAFALCYVLVSIPLANIADRGNRKRLLLSGVAVWSAMTLASAFAWNFASLFVTRAGVAVGEAVLVPIAVSMIADLYPPERRALPTSVLLTVRAVMSQGALLLGGGAVALAMLAARSLGFAPWRLTFVVVALPGIVVALVFALTVSEPVRAGAGHATSASVSIRAAARHLLSYAGLYLGMFLGVACLCAVTIIMIAWMPTMLMREHGLSPTQAGLAYGAPALIGAVAGTLSAPLILKRLAALAETTKLVLIAILGVALMPVAALLIVAASLPLVMTGIGVAMVGGLGSSVLPPLLVQALAPPRFRARLVALYLTILTLLGQGAGPSLVTTLAAVVPASALSVSIARAVWLMLALAAACLAIAATSARRRSKRPCEQIELEGTQR